MKHLKVLLSLAVFLAFIACNEELINDGSVEGSYSEEASVSDEKLEKEEKRRGRCKNIGSAKVKATSRNMEIEVLPSNSDFVNHIYLVSPGPPTFLAIDDNTGAVVALPTVRKNRELVFEIRVNDSSPVWKTGPGSRNSDGRRHAVVEQCGDNYTVNFEDIDASGWGTADEPNFVDAVFAVRPR